MVKTVDEEPYVELARWHLIHDPVGKRLVGIPAGSRRGRITSPVVAYDHEARRAVTESGRVYRLVGEPDPVVGAILARAHARKWGLTTFEIALAEIEELADEQEAGTGPRRGLN